jgi:hypothetical protein
LLSAWLNATGAPPEFKTALDEFVELLDKYNLGDPEDEETGKDLARMRALIRYYFKTDPDSLSDEEFARLWGELNFCLALEGRKFEKMFGGS